MSIWRAYEDIQKYLNTLRPFEKEVLVFFLSLCGAIAVAEFIRFTLSLAQMFMCYTELAIQFLAYKIKQNLKKGKQLHLLSDLHYTYFT